MNRETLIWIIVLIIAAVGLGLNWFIGDGFGRSYVEVTERTFANVGTAQDPDWVALDSPEALDHDVSAAVETISWEKVERTTPRDYAEAEAADPNQTRVRFSWVQTFGLWLAAFFTLSIFSFLYKDNPLYKIAESSVVGISAAYWMVVAFWDTLVPNLAFKLFPDTIQAWALPGAEGERELIYVIPLVLGVMLLWRLAPVGAWIARWPMAFIIGVFCGLRLVNFLLADFLAQIQPGIEPLIMLDGGSFDFWATLRQVTLLVGVLCCLVYFFFSIEHKGAVGGAARVGIWFLMITFGAAFGFTVMGRIALFAIRLEFLFDDWLWLIDPTAKRAALDVGLILIRGG